MFYNGLNKRSKIMKEIIIKIGVKLKTDEITEEEAKTLLLRLFGVVNTFFCDKHPNARTFTSTNGKVCCIKCTMG